MSWLPLDRVAGSVVDDNGPKSPHLREAGEGARLTRILNASPVRGPAF